MNGSATVPVILALNPSGILTMKDAGQEMVFAAPVNQVSVRFTSWGTMVVQAQGRQHDIVGVGASLSPSPSPAQLDELAAARGGNTGNDGTVTRLGSSGAALSAVDGMGTAAGVAGGIAMEYVYFRGLEAIRAWQETLPLAGATVKKNSMKAMKYFTVAVLAALVIALMVGLFIK
ncbi:hypothetical protein [Paenarthrobacter histidinolovorans]|uniref:hypothetical protein n=1 Tax=Paenarthrobacter histidinolovorans TaxID=43664 RepID=UPI0019CD8BA2|nr:hypothetical protein [Paenarthrobacter histidinolovorans]GGJ33667.1 hypothetical protein GCM10010052_33240 [Paenarthrobacter histidinolovorans]